ncbi:uncharacterized protein LOC114357552 [Ostrinia furnacalis]|nr:uncharacterized protein LOC114357552 [Ostrinia furnacalis]
MKLYGEDLKSVLQRFRRTPDYLKILNDKKEELKAYLEEVGLQTLYHYNNKMTEKIENMYRPKEDQETTVSDGLRSVRSPFINLPVDSHFGSNHIQDYIHHLHNPGRQGEEDNRSPVEKLDSYHLLTSSLTLQERNMFRDLGFEFAGKIIHSIIKSMGEDFSEKSTRLPLHGVDDRKYSSTTEHYHDMFPQDNPSTQADVVPTDETFMYKYRAPKVSGMKKNKIKK